MGDGERERCSRGAVFSLLASRPRIRCTLNPRTILGAVVVVVVVVVVDGVGPTVGLPMVNTGSGSD